MGNLTNNLSRHEFACKCGCGFDSIDYETVKIIQETCDHFDSRVTINSGCRCKRHNQMVGGGEKSQHLLGRAGDCRFWEVTPTEVYAYLNAKYPDRYGLGL